MMDSLLLAVKVVTPLFVMMLIGYFLKYKAVLDEHSISAINKMIFWVFMPLLLFCNIYEGDTSYLIDPWLIVFSIASVVVTFLVLMILIPRLEKDQRKAAAIVHGVIHPNVSLFGLPVALLLYGQGNVQIVIVLMAIIIPVHNILSVVALKWFCGGKTNIISIMKGVLTNPFIITIIVGLLIKQFNLLLPSIAYSTMKSLASVTTPLAFVALGASFTFKAAAQNIRPLAVATAARLVIVPLVWIVLAIIWGWRGQAILALLVLLAPPAGVSSYPLTLVMGGDGEMANNIVVSTSLFSILTIFLWIFVLNVNGIL